MVLIRCEECEASISSRASVCPKCGCPQSTHETISSGQPGEASSQVSKSVPLAAQHPIPDYLLEQDEVRKSGIDSAGRIMVVVALLVTVGFASNNILHISPARLQPESASTPSKGSAPIDFPPASSAVVPKELEWYQGGTLHDSNLAVWRVSSYRNRLATAGDTVSRSREINGKPPLSLRETRLRAEEMEVRISLVASDESLGHISVKEAGAKAYVALGWWE